MMGPRRLSHARFISEVMSMGVGLPATGTVTETGPFASPTKLIFSFHSRTMWIVNFASGCRARTSIASCSSTESPALVRVRWSSSVG
jgi:hypothetical protein